MRRPIPLLSLRPSPPRGIPLRLVLAAAILAAAASTGQAADGGFLGRFEAWEAFRKTVGGEAVCYIATTPRHSDRKVAGRGEVVLMVSRWPKRRIAAQVKVAAGYALKPDGDLELHFARKTYKLWTKGRDGWAADAKADKAIVESMESGKTLRAVSHPARGPAVTDRFSLDGFTKAWAAARKACAK